MKKNLLISGLLAHLILCTSLNAEVPPKLVAQALSDLRQAAELQEAEWSENMREAAEKELTISKSPLGLSPTALAEYERGELLVSSLVLQELVKDIRAQLEGREIALPRLAEYYLSVYDQAKLNQQQKILCYLSLRVVQRKIDETIQS